MPAAEALHHTAEHVVNTMDQRLMLGMAVGGGFLFVCACAGCVRAMSQLSKMRSQYTSLPHTQSTSGQTAEAEEQEREQILSEVYGRPQGEAFDEEDQDDSPLKDAELNRAWEAIEHAESSGDEDVNQLIAMEDLPDGFGPTAETGAAASGAGKGIQQPRAERGKAEGSRAASSGTHAASDKV
eukprot:CAMPEP_0113820966 /NCGR_PEP_ID=MMETSP0328-20130328/1502_1 /TAXON_ID=39455 /ORGANISM="Alexandrium minutum" /LENGTH=182 /DNA_ID=CAMNT_0000788897 /DNA_START=35 /DNA_END=583 /DNA_ORIENTATION=- /assembly_acc=CAM_ASM_000350